MNTNTRRNTFLIITCSILLFFSTFSFDVSSSITFVIHEQTTANLSNNQFAGSHTREGEKFLNDKEYVKAIEEFDTAIELDANFTDAYILKGIVLEKMGLDSRYIEKGIAQAWLGEREEALKTYDRALELNSSKVEN